MSFMLTPSSFHADNYDTNAWNAIKVYFHLQTKEPKLTYEIHFMERERPSCLCEQRF